MTDQEEWYAFFESHSARIIARFLLETEFTHVKHRTDVIKRFKDHTQKRDRFMRQPTAIVTAIGSFLHYHDAYGSLRRVSRLFHAHVKTIRGVYDFSIIPAALRRSNIEPSKDEYGLMRQLPDAFGHIYCETIRSINAITSARPDLPATLWVKKGTELYPAPNVKHVFLRDEECAKAASLAFQLATTWAGEVCLDHIPDTVLILECQNDEIDNSKFTFPPNLRSLNLDAVGRITTLALRRFSEQIQQQQSLEVICFRLEFEWWCRPVIASSASAAAATAAASNPADETDAEEEEDQKESWREEFTGLILEPFQFRTPPRCTHLQMPLLGTIDVSAVKAFEVVRFGVLHHRRWIQSEKRWETTISGRLTGNARAHTLVLDLLYTKKSDICEIWKLLREHVISHLEGVQLLHLVIKEDAVPCKWMFIGEQPFMRGIVGMKLKISYGFGWAMGSEVVCTQRKTRWMLENATMRSDLWNEELARFNATEPV